MSRLPEARPAYIWQLNKDTDYPHRPTYVFSAHFVLTRAHPGSISRSGTHPEIAPGQARLTSEFFRDRLPEKKLQLVGMSILLTLLSPGPECHILTQSQVRNVLSWPRPVRPVPTAHVPHPCVQCQRSMCYVRASSANGASQMPAH